MNRRILLGVLLLELNVIGFTAFSQIKLSPLFTDHMVLQQRTQTPIWGEATPDKKIEITTSWNNKTYSTVADSEGKWSIKVGTPKAGGPYRITVSDGTPVTLDDVLIGEVWLCSGQSNMSMPVKGWGKVKNYQQELENGNYPNIRLLQVNPATSPEPVSEFTVWGDHGWQACSSKMLEEFSATAYFFGRDLYENRKVPVGLIHSSWGGTILEAWMSLESLTPMRGREDAFEILSKYKEAAKKGEKDSGEPNRFSVLFNAMIHPLIPYAIKGVIWYQGEAHVGQPILYRDILPMLIADWRGCWEYNFPFYIVQLANFTELQKTPVESGWAGIREAQSMTAAHVENTGLAVTIDLGEVADIHPKNKQEVGRRLSLAVRAQTYGEKISYSGPTFQSYRIEGNKIRLFFIHTDRGLKAHDGTTLRGFTIAGVDHLFHWADAVIEGNTVLVSSPEVTQPLAVRYAWADNPICNLYNGAELPASPFRTDDWR